jgi:hypothetical protein
VGKIRLNCWLREDFLAQMSFSFKEKEKEDWRCPSSGRVPALQV